MNGIIQPHQRMARNGNTPHEKDEEEFYRNPPK
jgi:hypothetical protein